MSGSPPGMGDPTVLKRTACARCHRMKAKCERQVGDTLLEEPCQRCQKQGHPCDMDGRIANAPRPRPRLSVAGGLGPSASSSSSGQVPRSHSLSEPTTSAGSEPIHSAESAAARFAMFRGPATEGGSFASGSGFVLPAVSPEEASMPGSIERLSRPHGVPVSKPKAKRKRSPKPAGRREDEVDELSPGPGEEDEDPEQLLDSHFEVFVRRFEASYERRLAQTATMLASEIAASGPSDLVARFDAVPQRFKRAKEELDEEYARKRAKLKEMMIGRLETWAEKPTGVAAGPSSPAGGGTSAVEQEVKSAPAPLPSPAASAPSFSRPILQPPAGATGPTPGQTTPSPPRPTALAPQRPPASTDLSSTLGVLNATREVRMHPSPPSVKEQALAPEPAAEEEKEPKEEVLGGLDGAPTWV